VAYSLIFYETLSIGCVTGYAIKYSTENDVIAGIDKGIKELTIKI
jgi:hypothetical protein